MSNVPTGHTTGVGSGCGLSGNVPMKEMKLSLGVDQISRSQAVLNVSLDGSPDLAGYDLSVYDVSGRLRRQFNPGEIASNGGQLIWDMTDGQGQRLSSGIYFMRLKGQKSSITQRILALH
jgi:hypothetical protein